MNETRPVPLVEKLVPVPDPLRCCERLAELPYRLQFHPESAASEYGYAMLDRFLRGARARLHELPTGADGAHDAAEATLPEAMPWASRRDEADGTFVPPPVSLVH